MLFFCNFMENKNRNFKYSEPEKPNAIGIPIIEMSVRRKINNHS